jgi:hypothetical protein
MITSQRRELPSKINIYYATWTRLGLSGTRRQQRLTKLRTPRKHAQRGGFDAVTMLAALGLTDPVRLSRRAVNESRLARRRA